MFDSFFGRKRNYACRNLDISVFVNLGRQELHNKCQSGCRTILYQ